jgi:hypothetical protein
VVRLFLLAWLTAFAVQTTDLLTLVVPDSCTEDVSGSAGDPCPDACPRCLCCARVPASMPQATVAVIAQQVALSAQRPPLDPSTTPSPYGIYHVPKNS